MAIGYLALGLTAIEAVSKDDTEDLAVVRAPFSEALALAVSGAIQDSLTVAMLLRAHHMAVIGELPSHLASNMLSCKR